MIHSKSLLQLSNKKIKDPYMSRKFNIIFIGFPMILIAFVVVDFCLSPQSRQHDPAVWIQAAGAFGISMGVLLTTWAHRRYVPPDQNKAVTLDLNSQVTVECVGVPGTGKTYRLNEYYDNKE